MAAGWIFYDDHVLELDVVLSEEFAGEAEVTEFPVEEGADISDHVRAKALAFKLDAVVSNTPILEPENRPTLRYMGAASPPRFEVSNPQPREDRAGWAEETLERLRQAGTLLRVVTKRHDLKSMVLVSFSDPVDKNTGDALRTVLAFRRIVTVSTQQVEVAKPPGARQRRGHQPTKPAPAPVAEKAQQRVSILAQGVDFVVGAATGQ